jgi:hypothetical protein
MDLSQYFTAEHFWAIVFAIMVSWAVTEPIKRIVRKTPNRQDDYIPLIVSYLVAATVIFYKWPGDLIEDIMMAVVFGTSAPILHNICITAIGKKWPWLRTIITGERKTYEPDDLTGEDVTAWIPPEEVKNRTQKKDKP